MENHPSCLGPVLGHRSSEVCFFIEDRVTPRLDVKSLSSRSWLKALGRVPGYNQAPPNVESAARQPNEESALTKCEIAASQQEIYHLKKQTKTFGSYWIAQVLSIYLFPLKMHHVQPSLFCSSAANTGRRPLSIPRVLQGDSTVSSPAPAQPSSSSPS